MPGKNKPKRLDRNRAWRVARRKKKRNLLVKGNSRNRKARPKKKNIVAKVVEKVVPKRILAKVSKKVVKAKKKE